MITLHIDYNKFSKSLLGGITSEIYFEINNQIFPEKKWNDFVIVILNTWLSEVGKIGLNESGNFLFMDGPISFSIMRTDTKSTFKGYIQNRKIIDEEISFDEFLQILIYSAIKTYEEMKKKKWENRDIDTLKKNIELILIEKNISFSL